MTAQVTSLQAFITLKGKPKKLEGDQLTVYNAVRTHGPICNLRIEELTGLKINKVTGRCNDLRKDYYPPILKEAFVAKYKGNNAKHWVINDLVSSAYKRIEKERAAEQRKAYKIISYTRKVQNPAQISFFGGQNG